MNLAQSLGAAAAALVMGLSSAGLAPAQTMSEVVAKARAQLASTVVRYVATGASPLTSECRQSTIQISPRGDQRPHSTLPDRRIHNGRPAVRL